MSGGLLQLEIALLSGFCTGASSGKLTESNYSNYNRPGNQLRDSHGHAQ